MCSCGGKAKKYTVRYPDGHTEVKLSEAAARRAAALVPGATYTQT